MSMAEAAQAAAAAGGGPAATDISMAESGGDDQDLAYGRSSLQSVKSFSYPLI